MNLTLQQIERLKYYSGYFKAYFRFHNIAFETSNMHVLDMFIPTNLFTCNQFFFAIRYVSSSESLNVPNFVTPIPLYHIGMYLDCELLRILALNHVTPREAPSLLSILRNIWSDDHPHVLFVQRLLIAYRPTGLTMSDIQSMSLGSLREFRNRVRCLVRSIPHFGQLCCLCGGNCPDIVLRCCTQRFVFSLAHYSCLRIRIIVFSQTRCSRCNYCYESCPPRHYFESRQWFYHLYPRETIPSGRPTAYVAMLETFISFFPYLRAEYESHISELPTIQNYYDARKGYWRPG